MKSQKVATKNRALKVAILDRDLTQRRVARKARIDETRLSRIISGEVPADLREQKTLARILQCPVSALFPDTAVTW